MEELVAKLRADYPTLVFTAAAQASWSPAKCQVGYVDSDNREALWGTLHELGHALLGHASYTTDVSLLEKEVSAWAKAETLATQYGLAIEPDHIQDCLDTYRNWLHQRSRCPKCLVSGAQSADNRYSCMNCKSVWLVSHERFCRPYRRFEAK